MNNPEFNNENEEDEYITKKEAVYLIQQMIIEKKNEPNTKTKREELDTLYKTLIQYQEEIVEDISNQTQEKP